VAADRSRPLPPLPGSLLVLGRAEHLQTKVGGARVDVVAVERCLAGVAGVAAAAARAWPHPARPQDSLLAAYVVPSEAREDASEEAPERSAAAGDAGLVARLRAAAAADLPPPARPVSYTLLGVLPRSAAGKVLRSALPAPAALGAGPPEQPGDAPASDRLQPDEQAPRVQGQGQQATPATSEARVMAAFVAALAGASRGAAPRLEATSDFFAAGGGDSLAAAAAAGALGVDVRLVLAYPTARGLAAALARGAAAATGGAPPPQRRGGTGGGGGGEEEEGEGLVPAAKRRRTVVEVPPAAGVGAAAAAAAVTGSPPLVLRHMLTRAAAGTIVGPAGIQQAAQLSAAATAPVQAYPEAVAAAAPSSAAEAGAPAPPAQEPRVLWRQPLGQCVDAAPELLLLRPREAAGGAALGARAFALACSHSGLVACFDAGGDGAVAPGACLWRTQLPGRCDAGLAAEPRLAEVAVACSGGRLACLDLASGALLREVPCGGELRAAPAADAWPGWGWWWAASHGRELLAMQPGDGGAVLR
jgi:hypothetical protein